MGEIKNIIRLERDEEVGTYGDGFDYDVKYLGDRIRKVREIVEAIQELNRKILGKKLTEEEIFLSYIKGNEDEVYNKLIENIYDSDKENFKTINDFISWDGAIELLDELAGTDDDYELLCKNNNCKFGTVGYSQWSYYVAWEDIGETFIRDLYEGWNWYIVIKDDEDGESVGNCYITDTDELDSYVKDLFGIDADDYYLVDNEYAEYFDKPKIEEE